MNATGVIDFNDAQGLAYSSTIFSEAALNDGTISNTLTITLTGDTFTAGPFTDGVEYTVTNEPAGLTGVVTRTSGTTVTVALTGTAGAHANANDIANLTVTFTNSAFAGLNASLISNSNLTTLVVDFYDTITVEFASSTATQSEATTPLSVALTVSGGSLSSPGSVLMSALTTGTATGSDTQVLMSVGNTAQVSPTIFEYDVFLTNTGTTTLALRGYSFGLNLNPTYVNGGTLTHTYVANSRDVAINTLPAVTPSVLDTHIKATTTNALLGSEITLASNTPYKLARMQVVNSGANFLTSEDPFTNLTPGVDAIQVVPVSGKTQSSITAIVNPSGVPGTSFVINGIANQPSSGVISGLTAVVLPATAPVVTSDYSLALPYTLSIPIGNYTTPQTITVPITLINDVITETSETIVLSLSSPVGAIVGSQSTMTTTITDNDTLSIGFSSPTYVSSEGAITTNLTLSVSGAILGTASSIDMAVTGGTATNGDDFVLTTPQTITIPAGDYSTVAGTVTIPITLTDDVNTESDESITVVLSNPVGISLGAQASTAVTITDNDVPGFTMTTLGTSMNEGDVNTTLYTLVLNTQPTSNVVITVSSDSTTASFNAPAFTFTPTNWNVPQQVNVSVLENSGINPEASTTTTFAIDDVLSDSAFTSAADQTASLGITDNDVQVVFSGATYTVNETSASVDVTLILSGGTIASAQTVDVVISGGTATSGGVDYTLTTPYTVTIPSGTYASGTTVTIPVLIQNDTLGEATETVLLSLDNESSQVFIGTQDTATLSIVDNDTASLSYDGFFMEDITNTGIIKTSGDGSQVSITLANGQFAISTGNFASGVDYVVSNLPLGLSLTITATSSTTATMTISGTATTHTYASSSPLSIVWNTSAFSGTPASLVTNYSYTNIQLFFNDATDLDIDNVSDATEATGINGGDANGDLIQDNIQPYVTNLPATSTLPAMGLEVGGNCHIISGATQTTESGTGVNDSSFSFALGLLDFNVACDFPGAVATVTLYFDQNYSQTWTFRKLSSSGSWITIVPVSRTQNTTTGFTQVVFSMTEGGLYDADGLTNGVLEDPIGPGTATSSSSGGGGGGGGVPKCGAGKVGVYPNCTDSTAPVVCMTGHLFNPDTGLKCTEFTNTVSSTTPLVNSCEPLIKYPVVLGKDNLPQDVYNLTLFLNTYEGEKLVLDTVYDIFDQAAVNRFQKKYWNEIIAPFGGKTVTGTVGKYTKGKINVMSCAKMVGCPYFTGVQKYGIMANDQVGRIQTYLNLLMGTTLNEPQYNATVFNAIRNYQTVYKTKILKPYGRTTGTGNWGPFTVQTSNEIAGCVQYAQ